MRLLILAIIIFVSLSLGAYLDNVTLARKNLVLDDFPWADKPSLMLLQFVTF